MITTPYGERSVLAMSAEDFTSNLKPRLVKASSKSTLRFHERTFLKSNTFRDGWPAAAAAGFTAWPPAAGFDSLATDGAFAGSAPAALGSAPVLRARTGNTIRVRSGLRRLNRVC